MEEAIVNKENYKKELRAYYNNLLRGRLLSLNTTELKDEELIKVITNYDSNEKTICNNYCSWVTIGDIVSSEYNGNPFKFVKFMSGEDVAFTINFSQFKYPMSPNKRGDIAFPSFDATKAHYVCSVDGQCISPEDFFKSHNGEKLLLLYSFPAVTAFGKEKTCYLFAHTNTSVVDIRNYVLLAQYHTLKDVIEYPTLNIPGTTISTKISPNSRLVILEDCRNQITNQFALSIFEEEFKKDFVSLFNSINSKIR